MANVESSIALRSIRQKLDRLIDQSLREKINVCLPKTLSKAFLVAHTPAGVSPSRWVAFAYYIVNQVLLRTIDKKFKTTKKNTGGTKRWISLSYTAFQHIGLSKYVAMRKQLLDIGVLECDNSYRYSHKAGGPDGETYGYRLGPAYRNQRIRYRTIRDAPTKALLIKHRRAALAKQKQRIREIAFVAKGWLQPERIELDKTAAREFLELYEAMTQSRLENRISQLGLDAAKQKEYRIQARNRQVHALRQVKKWGKAPHLTVDSKGGRFYNPLSLLLSPLRNFITYDGQSLVILDLKNSQPLHLLLLIDANFWTENSRLPWSLKELNLALWEATRERGEAAGQQEKKTSPITKPKNTKQATVHEQLTNAHFTKLVLEGKLYEFMVEKFSGKYFTRQRTDRFGTRELAKREVLKLMYFDNKKPHSPSQQPFAEFRQHFPAVAAVMDVLKRRSYKDFPVLLQKLETNVLLHRACRRVYAANPTAWFTTIHDAVVTTAEHAAFVKRIILDTYQEILGTEPTLKTINLHPEAPFDEARSYVEDKLNQEMGTLTDDTGKYALSLAEISGLLKVRDIEQRRRLQKVLYVPDSPHTPAGQGFLDPPRLNPFALPRRKLKKK